MLANVLTFVKELKWDNFYIKNDVIMMCLTYILKYFFLKISSVAGSTHLVKYVVQSMLIHTLSVYDWPVSLIRDLERVWVESEFLSESETKLCNEIKLNTKRERIDKETTQENYTGSSHKLRVVRTSCTSKEFLL